MDLVGHSDVNMNTTTTTSTTATRPTTFGVNMSLAADMVFNLQQSLSTTTTSKGPVINYREGAATKSENRGPKLFLPPFKTELNFLRPHL